LTTQYSGVVSELGIDQATEVIGVTSTFRRIREEREKCRASSKARAYTFYGHEHPRLHDFFAIYLLDNEGGRKEIVVGDRRLVFHRTEAPEDTDVETLVQTGAIPVCVGDGPFSKVAKVTQEHSVTRNVARFLGLLGDPVYQQLIDWSHGVEERGAGPFTETAGIIRLLSLAQMDNPSGVYDTVEKMIDARRAEIIEEQKANQDLENGLVELEAHYHGRTIKIGAVVSSAPLIARQARKRGIDVLVRKDPATGHGLVTAKAGIRLANSVACLRVEEAKLAGQPPPSNPQRPGLAGTEDRWVYKREQMESVINGGWIAPDLPATAMDIQTLATLVTMGLEGG